MTNSPKLKVKGLAWDATEEVRDFEQARYFPFSSELIIVVEDEVIRSYDDLARLLAEGRFKGKEFLEVMFLPIIVGG